MKTKYISITFTFLQICLQSLGNLYCSSDVHVEPTLFEIIDSLFSLPTSFNVRKYRSAISSTPRNGRKSTHLESILTDLPSQVHDTVISAVEALGNVQFPLQSLFSDGQFVINFTQSIRNPNVLFNITNEQPRTNSSIELLQDEHNTTNIDTDRTILTHSNGASRYPHNITSGTKQNQEMNHCANHDMQSSNIPAHKQTLSKWFSAHNNSNVRNVISFNDIYLIQKNYYLIEAICGMLEKDSTKYRILKSYLCRCFTGERINSRSLSIYNSYHDIISVTQASGINSYCISKTPVCTFRHQNSICKIQVDPFRESCIWIRQPYIPSSVLPQFINYNLSVALVGNLISINETTEFIEKVLSNGRVENSILISFFLYTAITVLQMISVLPLYLVCNILGFSILYFSEKFSNSRLCQYITIGSTGVLLLLLWVAYFAYRMVDTLGRRSLPLFSPLFGLVTVATSYFSFNTFLSVVIKFYFVFWNLGAFGYSWFGKACVIGSVILSIAVGHVLGLFSSDSNLDGDIDYIDLIGSSSNTEIICESTHGKSLQNSLLNRNSFPTAKLILFYMMRIIAFTLILHSTSNMALSVILIIIGLYGGTFDSLQHRVKMLYYQYISKPRGSIYLNPNSRNRIRTDIEKVKMKNNSSNGSLYSEIRSSKKITDGAPAGNRHDNMDTRNGIDAGNFFGSYASTGGRMPPRPVYGYSPSYLRFQLQSQSQFEARSRPPVTAAPQHNHVDNQTEISPHVAQTHLNTQHTCDQLGLDNDSPAYIEKLSAQGLQKCVNFHTKCELEKLRQYVATNLEEVTQNIDNSATRTLIQRFAEGDYSGVPFKPAEVLLPQHEWLSLAQLIPTWVKLVLILAGIGIALQVFAEYI